MNEAELYALERKLGHNLDPQRQSEIRDLYDIPADLLEEAHRLPSTILMYQLLRYYTASSLWRWLPELIDDVIGRGVELQTWARGGFIVPLFTVDKLVSLDVAQILSVLGPEEEESWLQVIPDRGAWEIQESVTGSPAVERPQLRYDWQEPENVRRVMQSGKDHFVDVGDIVVATRRWLASRLAGRALAFGGLERFTDPAVMFKTLFPVILHPSDDAILATRAALQEINIMGPTKVEVPGFRGPADWYL
jgi:hypothetical protein